MKKLFYLLFFLSFTAAAQKITITGRLLDDTGSALPAATVMLMNPKDSSLVNFASSNAVGYFELKNIARTSYLLRVSYVGLATFNKLVQPKETETIVELGDLPMKQQSQQLNEVVVQAERAPVVIKKDTIEFNAASFKTKENSNVEDLLKKLPGVEVETDGSIKAQGEAVQKVTVDGKEFFGRDPKIATQNLPAKAVDKVQIFDKKSDQAAFTGIDDGQREKTINLELKEEYKNGFFGNATGGYGTDSRYTGKLSLNRFKKNQQLSFLLMGNNINEQGFSIDEYMNFSGNSQQMMQGSGRGGGVRLTFNAGGSGQGGAQVNFGNRLSGLMSNYAGGVNFNHDFSKKTTLQSNYFYNQLEHDVQQTLDRENFFGDSSTFLNQKSKQYSTHYNHRINAVLEHKIDSANSIKWTTGFTNTRSESNVTSSSETHADDGSPINDSERSSYSTQGNNTFTTNALWRHRFNKKGRTFSANLSFGYSNIVSEGATESVNTYYQPINSVLEINQSNNQKTENTSTGATLSYTEPLGNRRYLEFNYNYNQNLNAVDRKVYDVREAGNELNDSLSAEYTSNYQYHRPGFNVRVNRSKYSVTVGASMQYTELNGNFISDEEKIFRPFSNVLPAAHFNYDFTSTRHLNIDYETSVQEPSITELQPVVDNTDPLNITLGNITLRPAYQHNLRTNFVTFNPVSFVNFFAFVNATYIQNAIINAQSIDVRGVRTTQPINVDHNTSISANASVGMPINKIGSRVSLSVNANQQYGVNVLESTNGPEVLSRVESTIAQSTLSSTFRYSYRYKEIFDTELSATLSRNATEYEFNTESNQLYFNNSYRAEANLSFLKHYQLTTSVEYLMYNSKTTDFNQNVELMNLAISRFILKNKKGELKVSANNLFNNNFGVSQTANANYVERSNTNNLGRYYMLSFTYAINKQLNPMGGSRPGGGGMRMIIRN
jgi:hypothetical protein